LRRPNEPFRAEKERARLSIRTGAVYCSKFLG
jgi:hypothetical protein